VVKEVESKEIDEDTTIKQDTRALLEQAKLALDGTDNQHALEASATRMKKEVANVTGREKEKCFITTFFFFFFFFFLETKFEMFHIDNFFAF
jgi:hypothetical protein